MMKRIMIFIFPFLFCFFFLGCATKKATNKTDKHAGFLSDYSKLTPDPDGTKGELWEKPGVDFKKYNKVLLDRILIYYKDDSDYKGIDPTELKALADYLHEAIVKALGDDYPVVAEPGPDVLRIRIAITDLIPTKAAMSVVVLVTPYATIGDLAAGKGTGSSPYVGEAAIETEVLDSRTNEQLVAYVERRIGKKYNIYLKEGAGEAVKKGASSYFKAYTTWGYVKEAFDYWAKKIRRKLDEVHGKAHKSNRPINESCSFLVQGCAVAPVMTIVHKKTTAWTLKPCIWLLMSC
ncbi:DUF3313 domain-containing protein [Thermodesulfobacteriota bacterium]